MSTVASTLLPLILGSLQALADALTVVLCLFRLMIIVSMLFTAIVFHLTATRNTSCLGYWYRASLTHNGLINWYCIWLHWLLQLCTAHVLRGSFHRRMVCTIRSHVAFPWWVSCDRCNILLLIAVDRYVIRVVPASVAASILTLGWIQSLSPLPPFSHIIRLAVFNGPLICPLLLT